MSTIIALIPARAGSERVKFKNIRELNGHPLIAYTIAIAKASKLFDHIIVSTDSERIADVALHYGAEVPFLRPKELADSQSLDISWLEFTLSKLNTVYSAFSILRPTSPFRTTAMIHKAWELLNRVKGVDSIRAVQLCH